MTARPRHALGRTARVVLRAALGLAMAALALAGQLALAGGAAKKSPFLLVYPAVLLASWLGEAVAGAAAVVGATLGLAYFILPPPGSFTIAAERDVIDLGLFVLISFTLLALAERRTRALRETARARAAAEDAVGAKEAMIEVVAHDLRNPLQTVTLNAELLQARAPLDDRMREALVRVLRSTERACRLVETIVERAHQGGMTFALRKTECQLSEIVDETLEPFEPIAATRSVRLERPRADALEGIVLCDPERLVQVLTNVVGNAIKFTPRDGVVQLDVERAVDGVHFTVRDTGCGMTSDELAHAFDRLWHGSRPGHGSGLGLWIARTLVEAHRGKITAESRVGEGTTIRIVLPAGSAEAREERRLVPAHAT